MQVGERVKIRRNRSGYTIESTAGKVKFKRVTSLNEMPKPWLGRWAANEAAILAIEESAEIAHLLSVSDKDQIRAGVEALRNKNYKKIPPNIKAVYDLLRNAPWKKRDDAADFGDVVHRTLDALMRGDPLPDDLKTEVELQCAMNAEELWNQFIEGGEVIASEVTVVHPGAPVPYAGTLDLYSELRVGDKVLSDWKTSGGGPYTDWSTQFLAYKNAEYALINPTEHRQVSKQVETWTAEVVEWGPHMVDRIMVAHIRPEFARLYEVLPEVHDRGWEVFKSASQVKQWDGDTDDYRSEPKVPVFSPPILEVLP